MSLFLVLVSDYDFDSPLFVSSKSELELDDMSRSYH